MTPTIAFLTVALITLPQWCLMLLKPHSKWTQQLVDSDMIPFVLLLIYVSSMAQINQSELTFSSIEHLLQLFVIEDLALGAWALIGFLSLVIGGWIFNKFHLSVGRF